MSAIYNLKTLVYQLILDKIKESAIVSNEECTYNIVNHYHKIHINKNISMFLSIKSVNVDSVDRKIFYYKINFNLILFFNKEFFNSNEKIVFNILEKILNLLYSMEFYYCYNVNNSNIDVKLPIENIDKLDIPYITVEWITNLDLNNNNNWFN